MKRILLSVITVFCISYTIAQPTAGLMAYWPLNGNFTDAGPNNLTTTNTGVTAATNLSGTSNGAMFFNNTLSGSGSVVPATSYGAVTVNAASANIGFSSSSSYTMAHWFRLTSIATSLGGGFFDNNMNYNGYGTWAWRSGGSGGPIQLHFNAGGVNVQSPTATVTINLNTWYHLAGVKDGGTLRLYVNGVQVATTTPAGGFSAATYTQQPKFGTLWFNTAGYFNYAPFQGNLDELRLYNRALTLAEIQQMYALLPVKLTSFTATKNVDAVDLAWQTEYEQNSSHFNIQRSIDGINFSTINTIQAKGNSSVISNYQFTDNTAKNLANVKTVFYRLEMVDIDTRKENSSTVTVKLDADKKQLTILQNPTGNDLRIQFSSSVKEIAHLAITDAAGKQLLTKQIQINIGTVSTAIPINVLAAGNYYITVTSTQGKQTKAFLKQ